MKTDNVIRLEAMIIPIINADIKVICACFLSAESGCPFCFFRFGFWQLVHMNKHAFGYVPRLAGLSF